MDIPQEIVLSPEIAAEQDYQTAMAQLALLVDQLKQVDGFVLFVGTVKNGKEGADNVINYTYTRVRFPLEDAAKSIREYRKHIADDFNKL